MSQVDTEYKLIGARVYDPTEPSLFGKGKKSERAEYRQVRCSCDSCPLLANRQCVTVSMFGCRCPYGKYTVETGPTQRANSYYEWVSTRKKSAKEVGWLSLPTKKLAFIGDYIYIPYSHADMCKQIPFTAHSAFFISGVPFIRREAWTIENVLLLIDFRPQAMMGGEITAYQKEEVPRFLSHIRELDPDMWSEVIAARPELDVAPNYVGREAILSTLTHPITIPPKDSRHPVSWIWDGLTLTTTDKHCYSDTWGGIPCKSLVLSLAPEDDATVKVADNSWVTGDTIFVD